MVSIYRQNLHLADRVMSALKGGVMLFYVKHSNHAVRTTKGARYTIVTSYDVNETEANAAKFSLDLGVCFPCLLLDVWIIGYVISNSLWLL